MDWSPTMVTYRRDLRGFDQEVGEILDVEHITLPASDFKQQDDADDLALVGSKSSNTARAAASGSRRAMPVLTLDVVNEWRGTGQGQNDRRERLRPTLCRTGLVQNKKNCSEAVMEKVVQGSS